MLNSNQLIKSKYD